MMELTGKAIMLKRLMILPEKSPLLSPEKRGRGESVDQKIVDAFSIFCVFVR